MSTELSQTLHRVFHVIKQIILSIVNQVEKVLVKANNHKDRVTLFSAVRTFKPNGLFISEYLTKDFYVILEKKR